VSRAEHVGIDLAIEPGSDTAGDWMRLLGENATTDRLARVERIGFVPDATTEGNPVTLMLIRMPDGSCVQAAMTLRLFLAAAGAARGRYGTP